MTIRQKIFISVGFIALGIMWALRPWKRRRSTEPKGPEIERIDGKSPQSDPDDLPVSHISIGEEHDIAAKESLDDELDVGTDSPQGATHSVLEGGVEIADSLQSTETDQQIMQQPLDREMDLGRRLNNSLESIGDDLESDTGSKSELPRPSGHHHPLINPIKRGGRPRGVEQLHNGSESLDPRRRRPEIVCFQSGREWSLAVELAGEFTCQQDGHILERDETHPDRRILRQTYGDVEVQFADGESARIDLGDRNQSYFVFRLAGEDQKRGRRVQSASSGAYLIVVPDSWKEMNVGSRPEPTVFAGYEAHYVALDPEGITHVAFELPTNGVFRIESSARTVDLVGQHPIRTGDDYGSLFVDKPPGLRVCDPRIWDTVASIVVGQEGLGKGRWRKEFYPVPGEAEQSLPAEVAKAPGGWYFLRFYDRNHMLIDSMDFRWIRDIKDIRILPLSPLPELNGHAPARIEFSHTSKCRVVPTKNSQSIEVERYNTLTIANIPLNPGKT